MGQDPGSGGAGPGSPVFRFDGARLSRYDHRPVAEFPVHLTVNGVSLATLIASPHDLTNLVVGFLRMQRLISSRDDLVALGVCPDSGAATVRIRGELPPRLTPILTSGCSGGITFDLPEPARSGTAQDSSGAAFPERFAPEAIFRAMEGLGQVADLYRHSGGIHSSAVSDGQTVLLHAEDVGRHNTIDRIAGEALLQGIDLSGAILVTSGRISSEMAAKGALLGVSVLASRTSPTDLAVRIADEAGIALIGYVRGRRFTVYTHPDRILADREPSAPVEEVVGVILAGGPSRRMGRNKALLPWKGATILEEVYRRMSGIFREVILVTNRPKEYSFLPCRMVPDIHPGLGALAGIHAGLRHGGAAHIFAVACDMPCLNDRLVRYLLSLRGEGDAVVPVGPLGPEPLHAVYGAGAIPAIEAALSEGRRKVTSFYDAVRLRQVGPEEMAPFDPEFRSFRNVNTPEDYSRLLDEEEASPSPPPGAVPADAGGADR
ncbi:MAG: formate dehydrogenase accessory sulfurtransferase FdhD [Deltaproteobacteria bacterium]